MTQTSKAEWQAAEARSWPKKRCCSKCGSPDHTIKTCTSISAYKD